ncbi:MAG: ABC transporter permease, partial [Chloroflexi bacterium]|nr:ABC transporter permease [Chloroflexota bacterium]
MILKNLLRRRARTLITLCGIAIGVAALVALGGFAEGYLNSFSTILTSSGADVIVTQSDASDILFSSVDALQGSQLAAIPGVKAISGALFGLGSTPDTPFFVVLGLDPKEFAIRHFEIVEGQPLGGAHQMLLGRAAQRNLNKKLGDNYRIRESSFRIVGVYETGSGFEENGAVISLKDAQKVLGKPDQVTYYQLQVQRPAMTPNVIQEVERRLPKLAASKSANYMESQTVTTVLRSMGWL